MAINKNFVVKNGLEVNTNQIFADPVTSNVGIGSTLPTVDLDVQGGIAATDVVTSLLRVSGYATFSQVQVNNNINVSGFSTVSKELNVLGMTSVTNFRVTGFSTFNQNVILDKDIRVVGFSTFVGVSTFNGSLSVAGLSTFYSGIDVTGHSEVDNLRVSGFSTFNNFVDVNASADISGNTTTDSLAVTGFGTISGRASLQNVTISGVTTANNFIDINASADISGNTTTNSLAVTGFSTVSGLSNLQNVTISGVTTATSLIAQQINASGIITGNSFRPSSGYYQSANGTNAFYVYDTSGNVAFQGTIGASQINNSSGYKAIDFTTSTTPFVNITNGLNVAAGATITGLTSTTQLYVTGVSTLGTVQVSSGIITAASGIVTYYGDGQYLDLTNNPSIGIGIGTTGGVVGYGITFIDFYGAGVSTSLYNSVAGIATIYFEGGGGGSASIGIGSTPGEAFTGIITAGNLWYNNILGRLFIYYQDNDAAQWVDAAPFNVGLITSLTGGISFGDGTASSPSWYFADDQTTGVFSPTNGQLTFVSVGSSILNINPGGIQVTGVATASGGFVGNLTGNATGLSGTPNITVGNIVGSALTITGISTFSSVGIGTTNPTSTLQVTGGDSRFGGVIETVSTATTYMSGSAMVLEMDVRQATTYTYTIPTGANIGIVSFRNMPAQTGRASGTTITLIATQNSAGTGNTTVATGIGTNCTVVGYENGAAVAGISTRGLVGSATTVTLSSTGSDRDFVSFFIHYTGGTNTTASSYQVYVTKNGGFRQGTVGV